MFPKDSDNIWEICEHVYWSAHIWKSIYIKMDVLKFTRKFDSAHIFFIWISFIVFIYLQ